MGALATPRHASPLLVLLCAAFWVLIAVRAEAQLNPLWDHYKVYVVNAPDPPPTAVMITLTDQFGQWTHDAPVLEQFANPVEKLIVPGGPGSVYPIINPLLHYAWWRLSPQPFQAQVAITNQFGDYMLDVSNAQFLLNPALKNQPGAPPEANHYKCYDCQGLPVNVLVQMRDQFGTWVANVAFPRYFCNPVVKHVGAAGNGGATYPILDPNQHYTCYEYLPEDPTQHTAIITDQFIIDQGVGLAPSRLLCVPTLKTGVTAAGTSTWGKLKQLYR